MADINKIRRDRKEEERTHASKIGTGSRQEDRINRDKEEEIEKMQENNRKKSVNSMQIKIDVLQVNLNRCRLAQELMIQMVYEQKIDIVIISEIYRAERDWKIDKIGKTAIWIDHRCKRNDK